MNMKLFLQSNLHETWRLKIQIPKTELKLQMDS